MNEKKANDGDRHCELSLYLTYQPCHFSRERRVC